MVNNAGIIEYNGIEFGPSDVEHYSKHFQVNTLGVVRTTKAFLPLLRSSKESSKEGSKESRIVIVTSTAARLVTSGLVVYSMSKFAARAFADGLRRELDGFGIRISTIEPLVYA